MKRRYPPEHYPIPAIQHTRAVVALTAALCNYEMCQQDAPKFAIAYLSRIRKWAEECKQQTTTRKLSKGARHAMDVCFDIFASYLAVENQIDTPMEKRCAVMVWVALTFIEEVRATCPIYWDGQYNRAWRYLYLNMNNLADKLCTIYPGMDEDGTEIYMQISCALDGEEYEGYPQDKEQAA